MSPDFFVLASATVVGLLGAAHLVFTFAGRRLLPSDPALRTAMQASTLVITRQTSVWRAWLGFNASHSLGALLWAAVYGHLAWVSPDRLFNSAYLQGLGAVVLVSYVVLAWRYWFDMPLRGLSLALLLYLTGLALA